MDDLGGGVDQGQNAKTEKTGRSWVSSRTARLSPGFGRPLIGRRRTTAPSGFASRSVVTMSLITLYSYCY